MTGTYDPDLNLVYWGTGNPGSDLYGEERKGDNLYTDSLVALDADTGQVIWQTRLPSQTIGGAITYSINGRQYVAIAAGGGAVAGTQVSLTPESDMAGGNNGIYVFALPQ